ncbi:MAG: prolipoprotein diacylglyceryl transferase [Gemmatimonadetes bacterium]|nr:prolipoprotein diacylglyceryl transferase [Gemmatimonadota bacterium]
MYPVVFRIGSFPITSFGLMMFAAFLVGAWILGKQLARYGMDSKLAWDLLAGMAIGGIVGARLYYVGLHFDDFLANPMGELFARGGLVWYGGFMGGVLGYWIQVRQRRLPMALMFDATAPALAIAYAIGRMGCFLVGDDYGIPTDSWIGIAFPEGSPPTTAGYLRSVGADVPADVPGTAILRVHPTQLYEVAAGLAMFAFLWRFGSRPHRSGQPFALFLLLYAVERFGIEFVRAKGDRVIAGLSTSQFASILLLVIGAWLYLGYGGEAVQPGAARSGSGSPARSAPT